MKVNYKPKIDGLRAIAVILYHAQITLFGHNFFKGGFIGVDIFFVISGYLITSIILKELITTGTIIRIDRGDESYFGMISKVPENTTSARPGFPLPTTHSFQVFLCM